MGKLNWFDIVLLVIFIASVIGGLRAGLARVIVGIVATIAGFLVGFWCYRLLAAKLMPWLQSETIANILGFLIIFIGVLILGSLISALLARLFRWMGLSWLNHLLGGLAGALRGALIVAALVDIVVAYSPSPTPAFLNESRVLPYAFQISALLAELAPRELKDMFTEEMQNLKQLSTPRASPHTHRA